MRITIIGAGIAGLTMAIALKRAGFQPEIFEASAQVGSAGAGLGLAPNAIKAFRKLGIDERIIPLGRQLPYLRILSKKGNVISENNSLQLSQQYGLDNFTIHRADLHQVLLKELQGISIHTGKKAVDLIRTGKTVQLKFADGSTYETAYLIIADGIYSSLRTRLIPDAKLRYAGYTCWRGVMNAEDLNIAGASETWGSEGRVGLVPLNKGQLYWFACINAKQDDPRFRHFGIADLVNHFKDFHQPIPKVLEQTPNTNLIRNDIFDLQPLSRFAFDNILLAGDAAHATTPNMGQGACQAIEDAAVLAKALENSPSLEQAFKTFEERRLDRTRYIIDQSRKVGQIAQLSNPILCGLRNLLLSHAPASLQQKQFDKLYEVVF